VVPLINDIVLFLPELILSLTIIGLLLSEITKIKKGSFLYSWISLVGITAAFFQTLFSSASVNTRIFGDSITIDNFTVFFKLLFLFLSGVVLLFVQAQKKRFTFEFYFYLICLTLSCCVLVAASNLILAFLSLLSVGALISLSLALNKRAGFSLNSEYKNMVISVFSCSMFIFGAGVLVGNVGDLNIYELQALLINKEVSANAVFLVFVLTIFSFSFVCGEV